MKNKTGFKKGIRNGFKAAIMILTAVIFLGQTACIPGMEEKDVSGRYECTFSFSRYLSEEDIATLEENGLGFAKDFTGRYELVLGADYTFEISFDSEKLKEDIFSEIESHRDELFALAMEKSGVEEKEYEIFATRAGYRDVDDCKDAMVEKLEEKITASEAFMQLEKKNAAGTYSVKKDTVTFETGTDVIQYGHATILENGSLMVKAFFGENEEAGFDRIG